MACCTKIVKKGRTKILPESESVVSDYIEGQDGYTGVKYLGTLTIKIVGCKTKHRYIFESGITRLIDSGDADCLFDYHSGSFEAIIDVESGNSEIESEPATAEPEVSGGDGQVYETSIDGVSANSPDLEK